MRSESLGEKGIGPGCRHGIPRCQTAEEPLLHDPQAAPAERLRDPGVDLRCHAGREAEAGKEATKNVPASCASLTNNDAAGVRLTHVFRLDSLVTPIVLRTP